MVQMKSAVITAVYDQYDVLKPACPQIGADVDWVCVTDDPDLKSEGWRTVYEPRPGLNPRRAAKLPKLFPWRYTNARSSIWLDASFRVISESFVQKALGYADPIAQFVHPWRDCAYEEAVETQRLLKYKGEPVDRQVMTYRRIKHPDHWGLWATGVIARYHTPTVKFMSIRWEEEIRKGSFQDQISQPVVLRLFGLRPVQFPGWHMDNPWVRYEGSERH